jgi:hypothetical protein
VRAAILLFVAGGVLGWIAIAAKVFSEFHARHSWPAAQGYVTDVRVKSYTGSSSRDHFPAAYAALTSCSMRSFSRSKNAIFLSSFSTTQFTSPPTRIAKPVMYNHNIRITTAPSEP